MRILKKDKTCLFFLLLILMLLSTEDSMQLLEALAMSVEIYSITIIALKVLVLEKATYFYEAV